MTIKKKKSLEGYLNEMVDKYTFTGEDLEALSKIESVEYGIPLLDNSGENLNPPMSYISRIQTLFEKKIMELEDMLTKGGVRREDVESLLVQNYQTQFENVFSFFDISPEYVPLYQIKDKKVEEDLFIDASSDRIYATYLPSAQLAFFRGDVPDDLLFYGSVHENVHHNLNKFTELNSLWERDRYVEEGITEFLTCLVLGMDRIEYLASVEEKNPGFLPKEKSPLGTPYDLCKQYFQLIHQKLGMDGVVDAYRQASNLYELNDFMYMNDIDIFHSK